MYPIWSASLLMVIGGLYYGWRAHHLTELSRQRKLRERVTYMLWKMAVGDEEETVTEAGVS